MSQRERDRGEETEVGRQRVRDRGGGTEGRAILETDGKRQRELTGEQIEWKRQRGDAQGNRQREETERRDIGEGAYKRDRERREQI